MSLFSSPGTIALASALFTMPGLCQTAPPLKPTETVAAALQAPALSYTSTFATYQPFGDTALVPWRQANDAVHKAGGWRAYAKESQAPAEGPVSVAPAKAQTAVPPSSPNVAAPAAAAGVKP